MRPLVCVFGCVVSACSAGASDPLEDPCQPAHLEDGGVAELVLGDGLVPVVEGQDVDLQLGVQGLWMFVLGARVQALDVGAGDRAGVVDLAALDQAGAPVSLELGCRVREFAEAADGFSQLTSPYFLPVDATHAPQLDGARVALRLEVRDHTGRRATAVRSVVAHLPARAHRMRGHGAEHVPSWPSGGAPQLAWQP